MFFISLHSKIQACVALSTTKVEYIAIGNCCGQIPWMKQQLEDFLHIFRSHTIEM